MSDPLAVTSQAESNSSGAATFTFQPVTHGQTWTGTITVPTAPPTAKFTVRVDGINRFTILGRPQVARWRSPTAAPSQ